MNRVCIVTSSQLSYNPRVVKEADALSEAGFDVRVVSVVPRQDRFEFDCGIARDREWRWDYVDARRKGMARFRWIRGALRQKASRSLYSRASAPSLRDYTYSRFFPELVRLATRQRADLFIAHNLQALPAAHRAARKQKALLGFDAEDFHRGEFYPADHGTDDYRLTCAVEEEYIPLCDYVTAASPGIAQRYAETLGMRTPTSILNVFPKAERHAGISHDELDRERPSDVFSMYWYSQVIGPGRGLEDALRSLSLLPESVVLSVRGTWADGYRNVFEGEAERLGVLERIRHLSPSSPTELVRRAAAHQVGLALEPGLTVNHQACISNKILAFLLAGIPVIATRTEGQEWLAEQARGGVCLFDSEDAAALASHVERLHLNTEEWNNAGQSAQSVCDSIFNWDLEKVKLVSAVTQCLDNASELAS